MAHNSFLCCSYLPEIEPRNKHWTNETIARFQMCVTGIKLQARVVEITENGVGVELTDLSTSYPRIISDVLIDEHLVLRASSPCKDLVNNRPVNKHDLQIDTPGHQGNIFKTFICNLSLCYSLLLKAMSIFLPKMTHFFPVELCIMETHWVIKVIY